MSDPLDRRPLETYPVRRPMQTRWSDNDMYGHLNNAAYYAIFDTAINGWLAENTGLDHVADEVLGVVAESACRFHGELGFPEPITVGLRVERLGRSSISYDLALFRGAEPADDASPSATCRWVHVYIDRRTRKSTVIPDALRSVAVDAMTEVRGALEPA